VSSQLLRSGVPPYEVNYLFFTHIFHFDHTCDYPNLFFSRFRSSLDAPLKQLNVFGPRGTVEFTNRMVEAFIDRRGPMLLKNVSVRDADEGLVHRTDLWEVECVNTTHGPTFNELSLAYKISAEGKSIVVSGDVTIPSPEYGSRDDAFASNSKLIEMAKDADLLIMDACLMHTTPGDLGRAAKKANARKVVLTHMFDPHDRGVASVRYGGREGEILVQPEYDEFIAEMNEIFDGDIIAAEDLKSIIV